MGWERGRAVFFADAEAVKQADNDIVGEEFGFGAIENTATTNTGRAFGVVAVFDEHGEGQILQTPASTCGETSCAGSLGRDDNPGKQRVCDVFFRVVKLP